MLTEQVTKHFEKMGARVKVRDTSHVPRWREPSPSYFTIDILHDRRGEYFEIARGEEAPEMEVLQVLPSDRHLLLYSRDGQRLLCGHDERHWFVAAIGERVSTVGDAKRALVPKILRDIVGRVAPEVTNNRRNPVFKRQGEWFFVPVREKLKVPDVELHRNEPLQRGTGSKPHICEELYRRGGRQVHIVGGQIVEEWVFLQRKRLDPKYGLGARTMQANAKVYVRGHVRHSDHATIRLDGWHRVYINGEVSNGSVKFLD